MLSCYYCKDSTVFQKNLMHLIVQSNTYQAIVITNGMESYSIFTYNCELMEWPGLWVYATVGFNARGDYYSNHPLTGLSNVHRIACANRPQTDWSNVVYKLSLSVDAVQEAKATCMRTYFEDRRLFGEVVQYTQFAEPCPCTAWQAWRDRRFRFQFDNIGYCFFQRFFTGNSLYLCCYSTE